jgi:antitoxin VapB
MVESERREVDGMGVQLNIKKGEARELAERLAAATGQTITEAVTEALRQRLRQVQFDQATSDNCLRTREADFYRLISGSRERWKGAMMSIDHADLLYDEDGLPR